MPRRRNLSTRSEAGINITPLGDVSLSLLLGFLVITPIIIESMAASLPQEGSGVAAGAVKQDPIIVYTAEHKILINGDEVERADLGEVLEEHFPPGADVEHKVMFTGSGEVPYKEIVALLDLLKTHGVEGIGIR